MNDLQTENNLLKIENKRLRDALETRPEMVCVELENDETFLIRDFNRFVEPGGRYRIEVTNKGEVWKFLCCINVGTPDKDVEFVTERTLDGMQDVHVTHTRKRTD